MKIKLRELVNVSILNDNDNYKFEGFVGDSEYINDNGELIFGYWKLICCFDAWLINHMYYLLDTKIDEKELYDKNNYFEVFNDNGELCGIEFKYIKRSVL